LRRDQKRIAEEDSVRSRRKSAIYIIAALAALTLCLYVAANAQSAPALPLLPNGVAYDAAGNLYFADTNRHQIYKSSLAGALTIVAGNGSQGFSGDGSAATNAQLNSPQGIAIGPDGTLYIADTANQRIRAVLNGQITTLAGNGTSGFAGDAGPAIAAELNSPTALAVDATGALLVCDSANHRIRRIAGGTITTIAGNGTQGFFGDGAAATAAELDTPSGVAVGPDGRIYIADSHNDRIRAIALDGTISTVAGSGIRGYSGDGKPATAAALSLPRGLFVTSSGTLLFADSNNQRLRSVDTNGIINTIAGSGVQGSSIDANAAAVAALDTPRGVAISTFGSPVFADAHNSQVRETLPNGNLYVPAGLAPLRTSSITLTAPTSAAYGQATVTANVSGIVGTPQGTVQLVDGSSVVTQATLNAGAATLAVPALAIGPHTLTAQYLGDGVNPAATSVPALVTIGTATVTAKANAATSEYGAAIPVLTGSLSGVAAQDAGDLSVVFTTIATALSPPGTYSITATLEGSASSKYSLVLAPNSGSLVITQATTLTAEQPLSQSSYAGLPLVLTAGVTSTTQGNPTGTVTFSDGNSVVASATLVNGSASATYLSPAAGNHTIVATYAGDSDFAASSSQAMVTTIGAMPDFTLTASSASQTIAAGGIASYTMTVSAQPAPFTGVVYLSVKGLPTGATATFSPPQTVPGTGSATVTMSVQTSAASGRLRGQQVRIVLLAASLLLPFMILGRRRRPLVLVALVALALASAEGCGARSIATSEASQQVVLLEVTGTATNLAGTVVTHSASVSLILQ
jgi:sugar lactone lactonase YvrE